MARFYMTCQTCRRRMRLIGTSTQTFNLPPQPVERYYHCPNCEAEWTYNLERNTQSPGVPADVARVGDT
jgi:hypothetical protein